MHALKEREKKKVRNWDKKPPNTANYKTSNYRARRDIVKDEAKKNWDYIGKKKH